MEGLVIIGFCEQDYQKIRGAMHIPFVCYDGFFKEQGRLSNITIDNFSGGFQVGQYLKKMGHRKILCISDNNICMDLERYQGLKAALQDEVVELLIIPMEKEERQRFYQDKLELIKQHTAIFAVSDYYALDMMHFLQEQRLSVPDDISIAGFDDIPLCTHIHPMLTTVWQSGKKRAELAIQMLKELKNGNHSGKTVVLPVILIVRESVKQRTET